MSPRRPERRNLLSDFSLSASRVDGACDANQTGGDGNSNACDGQPFTFRNRQAGVPYRIDETRPCDARGRDRDPKCPDCSEERGQPHTRSLPPPCVEMVAAKFRRPGRGFPNSARAKHQDRSHSHSDNFSRWGNCRMPFLRNQRDEKRQVTRHSWLFLVNIKSKGKASRDDEIKRCG
jgi:hypothetical protein